MPESLEDLAPYPSDVSSHARYEAVHAWARLVRTVPLRERVLGNDASVEEVDRYHDAKDVITGAFSTVYLLKALQEYAPGVADEVAGRLWMLLADGSSVPEMLVEWLREWRIDPERVAAVARGSQQEAA